MQSAEQEATVVVVMGGFWEPMWGLAAVAIGLAYAYAMGTALAEDEEEDEDKAD